MLQSHRKFLHFVPFSCNNAIQRFECEGMRDKLRIIALASLIKRHFASAHRFREEPMTGYYYLVEFTCELDLLLILIEYDFRL